MIYIREAIGSPKRGVGCNIKKIYDFGAKKIMFRRRNYSFNRINQFKPKIKKHSLFNKND